MHLVVTAPASAAPVLKTTSCSLDGALRGRVASVNERLELTLADGATLKIAGIDPPVPTPNDPELDAEARAKLAAWLDGREVLFRPVGERADRWGRTVALVSAPMETATISVGEALLDAGLARFSPGPGTRPCSNRFLAAEVRARDQKLGLWADPYYAVLSATDRGAFDEKSATNVVVEGVVTSVEQGRFRTDLHFGQRRGYDFSVTILPRHRKRFEAEGIDLRDLDGRNLRVRGLLDLRFGPRIEIASPEEIEILENAPRHEALSSVTSDQVPGPADRP